MLIILVHRLKTLLLGVKISLIAWLSWALRKTQSKRESRMPGLMIFLKSGTYLIPQAKCVAALWSLAWVTDGVSSMKAEIQWGARKKGNWAIDNCHSTVTSAPSLMMITLSPYTRWAKTQNQFELQFMPWSLQYKLSWYSLTDQQHSKDHDLWRDIIDHEKIVRQQFCPLGYIFVLQDSGNRPKDV